MMACWFAIAFHRQRAWKNGGSLNESIEFLRKSFDMKLIPSRNSRRGNRRDNRREALAKRRLERLESRILLVAEPVLEFPSLDVSSQVYDTSSVLVRFQPGSRPSEIGTSNGPESGERELLPGLWKMDVADGSDVAGTLDSLGFYPGLVYAEPNFEVSVAVQPNDSGIRQFMGTK